MTVEISNDATNGDVMSILFANCLIDKFIHDVNIRKNLNVVAQINLEWWNEPWVINDVTERSGEECLKN